MPTCEQHSAWIARDLCEFGCGVNILLSSWGPFPDGSPLLIAWELLLLGGRNLASAGIFYVSGTSLGESGHLRDSSFGSEKTACPVIGLLFSLGLIT